MDADSVLLVDDEEGIRKVLGISLADSGYQVLTAENGTQALELFRRERPPIVLTDIKMPGMDGIELLRRIKAEARDTEVIMITGHGDMDLAIRSLENEATYFITKPIEDKALQAALHRARQRIARRTEQRDSLRKAEELLARLTREADEADGAAPSPGAPGPTRREIGRVANRLRVCLLALDRIIDYGNPADLPRLRDMLQEITERIGAKAGGAAEKAT
jgi:DNA-binding NtrC family response regulator